MDGLLADLGKTVAERWISALALPGTVYLAAAVAAHSLGQEHPFDVHRLVDALTALASRPGTGTTGGQIVVVGAFVTGSACAGLAARALGTLAERLCLGTDWQSWPPGLRHLAQWRTDARKSGWKAARKTYDDLRRQAARDRRPRRPASRPADPPADPPAGRPAGQSADQAVSRPAAEATEDARREAEDARLRAELRMSRIAPELPARPTWSGDRINAVDIRLRRSLGLALDVVWPPLWLTVPDETRTQITTARQDLTRAATLFGWAALCLPLAWRWWPAVAASAVLATTARTRIRTAADTYALLLEATVRLHAHDLANRPGLTPETQLSQAAGHALTDLLALPEPPEPTPRCTAARRSLHAQTTPPPGA